MSEFLGLVWLHNLLNETVKTVMKCLSNLNKKISQAQAFFSEKLHLSYFRLFSRLFILKLCAYNSKFTDKLLHDSRSMRGQLNTDVSSLFFNQPCISLLLHARDLFTFISTDLQSVIP